MGAHTHTRVHAQQGCGETWLDPSTYFRSCGSKSQKVTVVRG